MKKGNRFRAGCLLVLVMFLITLLSLPATAAQGPVPAGRSPGSATAPQGVDDNYLEVGVEWVNDYPYCCKTSSSGTVCGYNLCDLVMCDDDAQGLRNQLGACGWTKRFDYGNSSAWEQDFKGLTKPGGGTEYYYVDTVDLAYFSGHANSSGLSFGEGGRNHDDEWLTYNDCHQEWGDGDMEWMAFSACQVLADAHRTDWYKCMDGLHLMMGFVTNMADSSHGPWLGWLLCYGYNMTQAWFTASDISQPSGRIVRVVAEDYKHFDDRPYHHNASDPTDHSSYWFWGHHTASAPPRQVDIELLQGEMPVFMTPRMTLDEANAQWAQLGTAFGIPTPARSAIQSAAQGEIWISTDGQLRMDPSSGLYGYTELDSLWVPPPTTTLTSEAAPELTLQDARQIADQFLNSNGLMPRDAEFDEVVADTLTQAQPPTSRVASETILQSQDTALQVVYSRVVTYTPPSALSSVQEPLEFSVMGPGAKLKVFIDPQAVPGRSIAEPAQDAVIGGTGGWRQVGQPGGRSLTVQATVPILTYAQIEKLFEHLEPTVALSYIPLLFESRQVLSHTVAYYEHPLGTGQDQLIPVYALNVEYTLAGQEVTTDTAYIPANPEFMAPLGLISPTLEIPDRVAIGQKLGLNAVDASKKLSDVGYDASLDFPLGTGDPDSYLYAWYRDSVSDENRIGTGRVFTYTVGLAGGPHPGMDPIAQSIILEVTDSLSPRPPSVSYDQLQLAIVPPIYLPLVMRNR